MRNLPTRRPWWLPPSMSAASPTSALCCWKHYDEKGLVFYTNLGSRKAHQIENNPQVSLLFLWHSAERQVMVIGKRDARRRWEVVKYFTAVRATATDFAPWVSKQSSDPSPRGILLKFLELKQKFQQGSAVAGAGRIPRRIEQMEFWQGRTPSARSLLYQSAIAAPEIDRLAP